MNELIKSKVPISEHLAKKWSEAVSVSVQRRKESGQSQQDIADILEVDRRYIIRLEKGELLTNLGDQYFALFGVSWL